MKISILNKLIYIFFIMALVLLSIDFILKIIRIESPCCKYIDLEGKEGKASECHNKITTTKEKSGSLKECKLMNGKIIEVKDYEIIKKEEDND